MAAQGSGALVLPSPPPWGLSLLLTPPRAPLPTQGPEEIAAAPHSEQRMRFSWEALLGGIPKGPPAPTYLEHLVKLRLGLLEVPQDGEDSEHGREVMADDGLAGGHHNVLAFEHEPVQGVLRERGRGRAQGRDSQLAPMAGEGTCKGVGGCVPPIRTYHPVQRPQDQGGGNGWS